MKKKFFAAGAASLALLALTGCSSLGELVGIAPLEFKMTKTAGQTYYVSVQSVGKHAKPDASSAIAGSLKMGDTVVVKGIVPLEGHLLTDQADSWLEIADGASVYYIPGNTVIGEELWEAQLNGLPPKGGVKVKNFTSSKHQDADADLDQASLSRKELLFILGANGSVASEDGKAYPVELTNYIKQQNPKASTEIKLAESERGLLDFPPLSSFVEIGPYQEFDMGAGLAAYMMAQALPPKHPLTVYVGKIVDRLLKNSTLPYAYSGYHVLVLKDDKTVNACAAPGGFIFVTTGMLKYLKSEEELALILAHEIGHLEFHHSVRELGVDDYAGFALAALTAGIDLNDPKTKEAIIKIATDTAQAIPLFDQMDPETQKKRITETVNFTMENTQKLIDAAKEQIAELLKIIGGNLEKGHAVEFEAAADRRAVSLATAAGYDANALLSVLERIKKDYNGFGEAYPANRDELVNQFKAAYSVKTPAKAIGDYKAIRNQVDKLTDADLFIKK